MSKEMGGAGPIMTVPDLHEALRQERDKTKLLVEILRDVLSWADERIPVTIRDRAERVLN